MNPLFHTDFSISDSLKSVRKSVLIYETIIVELFGIQTMYNSLFGILHNGGTWFISCILLCYFVYPLIQELIKVLSAKYRIIIASLVVFVLIYSNYVVVAFSLGGNYSNPLYRCLEFAFGVFLGSIIEKISFSNQVHKRNIVGMIIGMLSVFLILYCNIRATTVIAGVSLQDIIFLPLLSLIMIASYNIRFESLENSRMLAYVSKISYYFYLLQLFLWEIGGIIVDYFGIDKNSHKILISFSICVCLSVLVYELYDKPIQKCLNKLLGVNRKG